MRSWQDEIIWANVEAKLLELGWNYTDLAKAMNTKPQNIESLKKNGIGKKSQIKLAQALKISGESLFTIKKDPYDEKWFHLIKNESHEHTHINQIIKK